MARRRQSHLRYAVLIVVVALTACAATQPSPLSRKPGLDVAVVALGSGAPGTALQVARGVLAVQPNDVDALVIQGEAQLQLGDLLASKDSFEHAARERPGDKRAMLGLGKVAIRNDLTAAEAAFRRVLAVDAHDEAALTDLGVSLDLQGRHGEAQASYKAALAQDGNRLATRVDLGLSLALSGHAQEALEELKPPGLSPDVSPKVRQDLAAALTIAGDEKGAERVLSSDMTHEQAISAIASYEALR